MSLNCPTLSFSALTKIKKSYKSSSKRKTRSSRNETRRRTREKHFRISFKNSKARWSLLTMFRLKLRRQNYKRNESIRTNLNEKERFKRNFKKKLT